MAATEHNQSRSLKEIEQYYKRYNCTHEDVWVPFRSFDVQGIKCMTLIGGPAAIGSFETKSSGPVDVFIDFYSDELFGGYEDEPKSLAVSLSITCAFPWKLTCSLGPSYWHLLGTVLVAEYGDPAPPRHANRSGYQAAVEVLPEGCCGAIAFLWKPKPYTHEEYEAFEHGDENTSIGNDSARLASEPMPFIDRSAFLFIVAESIDALLEQATIELRGVVEDDITIWSKIVHGLEVVGMQARQ